MSIKIIHNAGFFSCCSVKLHQIIKFFNTQKKLPDIVDSSAQFKWYKTQNKSNDITFDYGTALTLEDCKSQYERTKFRYI